MRRIVGGLAMAAALASAACSTPQDALADAANNAAAPTSSDIVNHALDSVVAFRQEVSDYLATSGDNSLSDDPDATREWLKDASAMIADIEARYGEMLGALDAVETGGLEADFEVAAGPTLAEVRRWARAAGDWVEVQHEQFDLSAGCLKLLPDRAAAGVCYADALEEHARDWNAVAERVNGIAADVFTP